MHERSALGINASRGTQRIPTSERNPYLANYPKGPLHIHIRVKWTTRSRAITRNTYQVSHLVPFLCHAIQRNHIPMLKVIGQDSP